MRERFERPIRISLDAKARAIARFRPASGHAPSNEPPTQESNEFDATQQRRFEPAKCVPSAPGSPLQPLSRRAAPQKAPFIALTFDSPDTIIRSHVEQMLNTQKAHAQDGREGSQETHT